MIRCLIVDDEAPARLEMRQLLSAHPDVHVVGEAAGIADALELAARHQPELVFLDIQLRGETGFDFVARHDSPATRIVFVTAHDQHAIRGFECNALDYLLKPVRPERLKSTLERIAPPAPAATPTPQDPVFLKIGNTTRFVPWADILRIVTEGNYTRVHLATGESTLILRPLKDWLALCPDGLFCRAHRTALVQRRNIRAIHTLAEEKREILTTDEARIPIGRTYWSAFKVWIAS
jgi:two-component system LytT family response regulator